MKLTDCEVERLIPLFMRKQPDIVALCRELDPVIRDIGNKLKLLSFWGSLGDQPEEALDRKATDLDISWYRKGAALDKKREMIRSADQVHMKLGTKWAVDFVLSMYYDNAVSEEWFQYDGDPGHFRVIVRDTDFDPDLPMEMLDLLNEVKRAGAILDYVEHEWEEYLTQYIGAAHSRVQWRDPLPQVIPPTELDGRIYAGAAHAQVRSGTPLRMDAAALWLTEQIIRAGMARSRVDFGAVLPLVLEERENG